MPRSALPAEAGTQAAVAVRRLALAIVLAGTVSGVDAGAGEVSLKGRALSNVTAYIPPQCYTATRDAAGRVHNPCYVCHLNSVPPNFIDDGDLQLSYAFQAPARVNPWTNLFRDRRDQIAEIGDDTILAYVRTDNYQAPDGGIALARTLASVPVAWDVDEDGTWGGFVPDCRFDFDAEGFDRRADGRATGWRAFAYYPFPGTFWPTNGSMGDVAIRLPEMFRRDAGGTEDIAVYKLNLAIVEAVVRRREVSIDATDERRHGVDLDRDGTLGEARVVAYDWAPLEGREMSYVGAAREAQARGEVHLAGGLFPEGTEFLHSVRYLDVDDDGGITLAARMKELRYARKDFWQTYADLEEMVMAEIRERRGQPDRPRQVLGDAEHGVANGMGWTFQGFIEDADGDLRPQSYEESVFCVGCHGGAGVTTDAIFSFARRFGPEAFQGGWYHWSQRGLKGVPERRRADGRGEYSVYLERNGAGDEFRGNAEVLARFFAADGTLRPDRAALLADDVTVLLHPSRARALALNKAYKLIVEEQSFALGRDALPTPAVHVHKRLDPDQPTGIKEIADGP